MSDSEASVGVDLHEVIPAHEGLGPEQLKKPGHEAERILDHLRAAGIDPAMLSSQDLARVAHAVAFDTKMFEEPGALMAALREGGGIRDALTQTYDEKLESSGKNKEAQLLEEEEKERERKRKEALDDGPETALHVEEQGLSQRGLLSALAAVAKAGVNRIGTAEDALLPGEDGMRRADFVEQLAARDRPLSKVEQVRAQEEGAELLVRN